MSSAVERLLPQELPPRNVVIEQAVLGSILYSEEVLSSIDDILRPEHFSEPMHSRIYAAMLRRRTSLQLIDSIVLIAEFDGDAAIQEMGGSRKYFGELASRASAIVNVVAYARDLIDLAAVRSVHTLGAELQAAAMKGEPAARILAMARARIDEVAPALDGLRVTFPGDWPEPEMPALIRGVLGEDWIGLIYGEPSAGKSFFAVDLACCIAAGENWRGRQVIQGPVVYLAGERVRSVQNRVRAWLLRHGAAGKDVPIGVLPGPVDLLHPEADLGRVDAALREVAKRRGEPARLLVIDTLHAVSPGGKEDSADIGRLMHNVRKLQNGRKLTVLIIHHSGKDPGQGARGSNSSTAAADIEIEVVDGEEGQRQPIIRKMSDDEIPELEPFVIENVVLVRSEERTVKVGLHVAVAPAAARAADPKAQRARDMRAAGTSYAKIGKALGISKTTTMRWCAAC